MELSQKLKKELFLLINRAGEITSCSVASLEIGVEIGVRGHNNAMSPPDNMLREIVDKISFS